MSSPSLTGYSANNPRKYLGPNVAIVAIVTRNREPTGADIKDPNTGKYYGFGTQWLVGENPTTGERGDLWYLAYIEANVAKWFLIDSDSSSGTFTPTLQSTNNNLSLSYLQRQGQYQIVGDWVNVNIQFVVRIDAGVNTGNFIISGLPKNSFRICQLTGYMTSPDITPQQPALSFQANANNVLMFLSGNVSGAGMPVPSTTSTYNLQLYVTGSYIWRV